MSDMETKKPPQDPEFEALTDVLRALDPLSTAARTRVLCYFLARFNIPAQDIARWVGR